MSGALEHESYVQFLTDDLSRTVEINVDEVIYDDKQMGRSSVTQGNVTTQAADASAEGETIRKARDAATADQPTRTSWHMDITYQGLREGVDPSKLKPYEYFPRRYSLKIAEWNADGSRVGQPLVGRYQNAPVTDAGAYAK